MKNLILKLSIAATAIFGLSGCGSHDIDISPSQTGYVYKNDIAKSTRYNGGSDYVWVLPFEADYKTLILDYGTASLDYPIQFNLRNIENKTQIKAKATIVFRLIRNPADVDGELDFKDDDYVQFYSKNITAIKHSAHIMSITPESVYNKYMVEHLDKTFREVITDPTAYPDFDSVESNIEAIQKKVKERLTDAAINARIEIIGVRLSDVEVPEPIQRSRNKMLELQQDELNQVEELKIKTRNTSHRMAVEVREAINQVTLDKIAGQTNKSYMFIKTLNRAIDEKAPLNLSITPDFMRYLDGDTQKGRVADNSDIIEQMNNMTNEELVAHFSKTAIIE